MDLKKQKEVKQRKNILTFYRDKSESKRVFMPIGNGVNVKQHDLYFKGKTLLASPKGQSPTNNNIIKIDPIFQKTQTLNITGFGSLPLNFYVINNQIEWGDAQQLVRETHYLKPTTRGMILGVKISNHEKEKQIIKFLNSNTQKRNTNSYTQGSLVGCCVIDTLTFGDPDGRKFLKNYSKYKNKSRGEKAAKLRVAWLSRISVKDPFYGLGLGTLIVKNAVKVAYEYRFPKATCIEVIRTVSKSRAQELITSKNASDFLIRAGFKIAELPPKYALPKWLLDHSTGHLMPRNMINKDNEANRKLYYYVEKS